MEAFAALGLASNIIQFVDFSCKLFSTSQEIYSSASGASSRVTDASAIAGTLHELSGRLLARPQGTIGAASPTGTGDAVLFQLATNCRNAAVEIISLLDTIRAHSPHSKWGSFKAALSTVWKDDQIKALEKKLEDYRRQIIMTLEVMQRCSGNASAKAMGADTLQ